MPILSVFDGAVLTEEQCEAVEHVDSGGDSKVIASAGTGKTLTLQAIGHKKKGTSEKWGAYLAFNKAIATEASQKFSDNVECRTGHSVAFRKVGYKYQTRLKKVTGSMLVDGGFVGKRYGLPTKSAKGYLILDTIRRFCYSDDEYLMPYHVPTLPGYLDADHSKFLTKNILEKADAVWEDMSDLKGGLPITHDVYLKIWALGKPHLAKHFILCDEWQDANPVLAGVVNAQEHLQKIYVGDKFQQIYGWRGAINALDKLDTDHTSWLTQSFRFGDPIAEVANDILQTYVEGDKPPLLKGNPKQVSSVGPYNGQPHAILCRTNSGVISNVFKCLGKGVKPYVMGGVKSMVSMLLGARDLMSGKLSYHPELAVFNDWSEVVAHAQSEVGGDMLSFVNMVEKYGISKLVATLKQTVSDPKDAATTITTAHKAKGLEWPVVRLGSDFLTPPKDKPYPQGETNILYVAATRALNHLDNTDCIPANPKKLKYLQKNFISGNQIEDMFKSMLKKELKDV